jgi:hypothetical protein
MLEINKVKAVEQHCRKLEERLQGLHHEIQESMAGQHSKRVEQSKRNDQISIQIEALSNQFQLFLATQMARH